MAKSKKRVKPRPQKPPRATKAAKKAKKVKATKVVKKAKARKAAKNGKAKRKSKAAAPAKRKASAKKVGEQSVFQESAKQLIVGKHFKSATAFEEAVFRRLKHAKTITEVTFAAPYDDRDHFNFAGVDKLLGHSLPQLKKIVIGCGMQVANFALKDLHGVEELILGDTTYKDSCFDLSLPNLKALVLEYARPGPPVGAFAKSLEQCPRIETFYVHKYTCLMDALPTLYLPSCRRFCFRRGDCTSKLHLYAPRLTECNLDANYDLADVKFLTQGRASMKEFNLPQDKQPSRFRVSLLNAVLSNRALGYLEGHPRVLGIDGLEEGFRAEGFW